MRLLPVSRASTAIALVVGVGSLTGIVQFSWAQGNASAPSVVIVFDGSGSMWGRIDGDNKTNKFTVAREALRPALGKPDLTARVGLVSFGHRRKADCSDVELIAPPEPGPGERILGPLTRLNPRGKGPVAGGLREAAKALQGKPQSSIVLIHDNADNCGQDVCAAADEIAKSNPGIAIHVIGAALDADDAKRMACVPRGGGKLVNAEDATVLSSALGDAMRVAMLEKRPSAPSANAALDPKAANPTANAPTAPAADPGMTGLSLAARLGADGPAVEAPVAWRIARAGETEPLVQTTAPTLVRPLAAGKYDVEARVGGLSAKQTLEVVAGQTANAVLAMPGGRVRYALRNGKSGEGLKGALIALYPSADGKTAAPEAVALTREPAGEWHLAPGNYVLRVEQGGVRKDVPLALKAGGALGEEVQLGTGRLRAALLAREETAPLDGATFIVAEDDPESPQGLREVARSAAVQPDFVLRTGTYQVTARWNTHEVRQRVAIGAGDTVTANLQLGLGRVQVTQTLDAGLAKASPPVPVTTRVVRLDQGSREVASSAARNPTFELPPGRYRFETQAGDQNARAAGDMEVKPAGSGTLALRLDAGQVQLRGAGGALLALPGETFWEIKDAKGRVVWRTTQTEPKAVLAPGRYTVRAERRDASSERALDVAAGDVRTVDFGKP